MPSGERVLVIESGPRELTEKFLKRLYQTHWIEQVDLVTCYAESPASFDAWRGAVYSIHKSRWLSRLSRSHYTLLAIFCARSPILNKWKWVIALLIHAKILIVNEHADYFYLNFANRDNLKRLLAERLRAHAIDLRAVAELALVPFTVTFLLAYATYVQMRRLRTAWR
jgi:hypothetical protein